LSGQRNRPIMIRWADAPESRARPIGVNGIAIRLIFTKRTNYRISNEINAIRYPCDGKRAYYFAQVKLAAWLGSPWPS
jgi:hypothetical protein